MKYVRDTFSGLILVINLIGCQGKIQFSTDGGQVRSFFKMEIHTGLQESCFRCHDPGSSDPGARLYPFAQTSDYFSYESLVSDPSRLQRMIERVEGREHPEPSYLSGAIKFNRSEFVENLRELQERLCRRDGRFCTKPSLLKDTAIKGTEVLSIGQSNTLQFNLAPVGFPQVNAQIGYRKDSLGYIQIHDLRIISPEADLEIEGVKAVFLNEASNQTITLIPSSALQQISKSSNILGTSNLMSTTVAQTAQWASDLPDVKLKFETVRLKVTNARDQFLFAVKPIIKRDCLTCHNVLSSSPARLKMSFGSNNSDLISDGDLYLLLKSKMVAGNPQQSLLIKKAADGEMGHSKILQGSSLEAFSSWILRETN